MIPAIEVSVRSPRWEKLDFDPAALAQNVAAYAVFAYLAAEADGDFGSQLKE